jgi:hypothetical protein
MAGAGSSPTASFAAPVRLFSSGQRVRNARRRRRRPINSPVEIHRDALDIDCHKRALRSPRAAANRAPELLFRQAI